MSDPAFEQTERGVADTLGVQKKVLAQTRMKNLARGEDWDYLGQIVHYTKAGVARLKVALGIQGAVPGAAGAQERPEKKAAAPAVEGVVQKKFPNRHLLEVTLPSELPPGTPDGVWAGAAVRMWVRDSKNFRVGMRVPLERPAGSEVWRLARKEPRWFGKW